MADNTLMDTLYGDTALTSVPMPVSLAEAARAYTLPAPNFFPTIQQWRQEILDMERFLTTAPQPEPATVMGVDLGSGERAGGGSELTEMDYPSSTSEGNYSMNAPDESCYTIDPLQTKFRRVSAALIEAGETLEEAAGDFEKVRSINSSLRHHNYSMMREIRTLTARDKEFLARDVAMLARIAELEKDNEDMRLQLSSIYRDEERAA